MAAEMIVCDEDVEVVDLDAMTAEELVKEQAACWAEIQMIEGQLGDPTRIYDLGAEAYADWRKRANWALRFRKIELHEIAAALTVRRLADIEAEKERRKAERAATAARKLQNKIENGWRPYKPVTKSAPVVSPEELERRTADARRRRALVVDALRGNGGADGLLIRVAVALHHLKGRGDLPADFPDECRQTLKDLSQYLKDLVGNGPLSGARAGTLTAASEVE